MADSQLTDETFEEEVLKSPIPVLVDLWAPWCGPCRALSPVIEEVAREYDGKAKIVKLNTDENSRTAARYRISAIPTLLFVKGGKIVDQLVGVRPKAEITKRMDAMLAA